MRCWLIRAASALAIAIALFCADVLSLRLHGHARTLDIGTWGEHELVHGFYAREQDELGTTFRWTGAQSSVRVAGFTVVPTAYVVVTFGPGLPPGTQPPLEVLARIDGSAPLQLAATGRARRYHLLPPPEALRDGQIELQLTGPATRIRDGRSVGVRVDRLALVWPSASWALPGWWLLAVQWTLTLIGAAIARLLGQERWIRAGIVAMLVAWLGFVTGRYLFFTLVWQTRMLVAGIALFLLAVAALRLLDRSHIAAGTPAEMRRLIFLAVVVAAIRLFGAVYPGFESHDQFVHYKRLASVQAGNLYITGHPSEFHNQVTIIPTAFYVALQPLTLLVENRMVATQAAYTLVDGIGALLTALFVRLIGGSYRAGILALLLVASLPNQLTILWWGFAPQIASNWLVVVLAVLMAQTPGLSRSAWIGAAIVVGATLMIHQGVAVLVGTWLCFYIGGVWLRRRSQRAYWLGWGRILLAGACLAFVLTYVDMAQLYLSGAPDTESRVAIGLESFRTSQLVKGLAASTRPIGPALAVLGIVILAMQTRDVHRLLVTAWGAAAGLFLVVDLLTGLQVRYAYFATPLFCAGLAWLLELLMIRTRWAKVAAWAVVALICYQGAVLWYAGTVWRVKPTLMGLTH